MKNSSMGFMAVASLLLLLLLGWNGGVEGKVEVGKFDLWEETPRDEWKSHIATLPEIQLDPKTGDYPVFNITERCGFALYKQCDSRWGGNRMGTSGTTICQVGCAISSVAQFLTAKGKNYNPGTFNAWLTSNGGYANGNLIIWATAERLGLTWRGQQNPTVDELARGLQACHGIISNVNGGGHWVLLTGYAGNNQFYVNDPGYNRGSYPFNEMLRHSVYW